MIFVDTNALILLIVGLIDKSLISSHKRTSIFESIDFDNLAFLIGDLDKVVTTPNILTEVDNLLNNFQKGHRWAYYQVLRELIAKSTEKFLESKIIMESNAFFELGLTDSGVLEISKECDFLITGDSRLSDYAKAFGIKVVDLVKIRNERLNWFHLSSEVIYLIDNFEYLTYEKSYVFIMKVTPEIKAKLEIHKKELFEKYPIKDLAIFGSYARNEQKEASDLDLMVEFHSRVGSEFIELADELEEILGMKVDLVSKKGIKDRYFERIKEDLIYV